MQARSLRDQNLTGHDVNPRYHFRNGVFHLNARIHFDKVEAIRIGIHQKLNRPGIVISRGLANRQSGIAQPLPQHARNSQRRRHFHYLLVTPLHGAIAFKKMHERAVLVAQYLHLDMAGAANILLQKNGIIAECGAGFFPGLFHFASKILHSLDDAHPAAAAAECGLHDQRVTNLPGRFRVG